MNTTTASRSESDARDQAVLQMQSVAALVAALECDYDRLEELRDEKDAGDYMGDWDDRPAAKELAELEAAAGDCADAGEARERITEDALSVEVRSDWGTPGEPMTAGEFRIVLCTGGPHVELVGDLQDGEPCSVRCTFCGWGESGELFDFNRDAALTYCQQFSFGE